MKTNVEFITDLMEHSNYGGLAQAFVVEAIMRYAEQISKATPEDLAAMKFISAHAWIGVAKEIKMKMESKYGGGEKVA